MGIEERISCLEDKVESLEHANKEIIEFVRKMFDVRDTIRIFGDSTGSGIDVNIRHLFHLILKHNNVWPVKTPEGIEFQERPKKEEK